MDESLVQLSGFFGIFRNHFNRDAGIDQTAESLPGDKRIRIFHGRDDAGDSGIYQCVGAGRRTAMMRARLQRDIESGVTSAFARLIQRKNLGMLSVGVSVKPAPHHLPAFDQHGAHGRVWAGATYSAPSQLERFVHRRGFHASNNDAMNFSGSNGSRSPACSPTPM